MATSGTFGGNGVSIGGNGGNYYWSAWQLAGQNVGGNYSTINWQTYFHYQGTDAQLDNGRTDTNAGGVWYNGGRVYNYAGNFSTRDMLLASGSFNIGHDGAGNQTLSMSGGVDVYQVGRSQGSGSWSLPTIPRYTSITSFTTPIVTDTTIKFDWNAADNCDYISWWSTAYDGGAHHDIGVSGTGTFSITLSNLQSAKQYDIKVAVRRADSGLWTESGTLYPTTLKQSNLFKVI